MNHAPYEMYRKETSSSFVSLLHSCYFDLS
nr:MAG TPA: hypothetical protein [Myoviridae sp. ctfuG5]